MFPLKDNIPTDRFPVVTVALIAINVVMYFAFQNGGFWFFEGGNAVFNERVDDYGAKPCELSGDCADAGPSAIATLVTSMFMHGSLLHLGGNMLFLWIFGNNVEDRMGRVKYLVFYLLGGLAALGAQVAIDPASAVPTIGTVLSGCTAMWATPATRPPSR